jgi:hypothetical protein
MGSIFTRSESPSKRRAIHWSDTDRASAKRSGMTLEVAGAIDVGSFPGSDEASPHLSRWIAACVSVLQRKHPAMADRYQPGILQLLGRECAQNGSLLPNHVDESGSQVELVLGGNGRQEVDWVGGHWVEDTTPQLRPQVSRAGNVGGSNSDDKERYESISELR